MGTEGEGRRGPRTSVVLIGTFAVVGAAIAGTLLVSRWLKPAESSTLEATTTSVDDSIDVELIGNGSPNKIIDRLTSSGISVRVHLSEEAGVLGGFPQADSAPKWCRAESMAQVTAVSDDAVAQSQIPVTEEPSPEASGQQFWGGQLEGAPIIGLILQVADDVVAAKATVAGGGNDEAEPVKGVVALAMPAPPPPEGRNPFEFGPPQVMSVDLLMADGTTERLDNEKLLQGPRMWWDPACQQGFVDGVPEQVEPPKPELPPPSGLRPADPEAALTEIKAAMKAVYSTAKSGDARRVELIDDPGGVQFAIDNVRKLDPDDRLGKFKYEFEDHVFLTDTEISFLYTLRIGDTGEVYWHQYGRARLMNGVWKITRATFCQDITHLGWSCGP